MCKIRFLSRESEVKTEVNAVITDNIDLKVNGFVVKTDGNNLKADYNVVKPNETVLILNEFD